MIGITVKDQKVVTYDYNGSENYFMYVKPAESGKPYQLYYAPVSAPKGWQSLSLTGLPSDGLLISQLLSITMLYMCRLQMALYIDPRMA